MRTLLSSFLLLSCTTVGSAGGFPELLSKPLQGSIEPNKKWSWPKPVDFETKWKGHDEARTHVVRTGQLSAFAHRWYDSATSSVASAPVPAWADVEKKSADEAHGCRATTFVLDREHGGKRYLSRLLEGESVWCRREQWEVVKVEGSKFYLRTEDAVGVLEANPVPAQAAMPEEYLSEWTYVATLLEPHGNSAQLLKDYEANAPMGRCSMDRAPASFASQFAEKCFKAGELACFLQVHLRVVGDQFNRVAWSSMGEASSPTKASQLEKAGIDVDRFYRGLVVVLPDERPSELGTSRLARALIESGRRDAFEPLLVKMIQDERLDTYNRFRALTTYVSLHYREKGEDAEMKAKLSKLKLDPLGSAWWAGLGK